LSPIDAWILEGGFEFLKHKVYQNNHVELAAVAEFLLVELNVKIREVVRVNNDLTNCIDFVIIRDVARLKLILVTVSINGNLDC